MPLIEGMKAPCTLYIATGDGTTEKRVLLPLIELYHVNRVLCFPKTPIPGENKERKTGLSVLEVLRSTLIETENYLFIVDKEYWGNSTEEDVRKMLKGMNLREIEISSKENTEFAKLHLIECKRGSKAITAYLAISGKEKKIEENIAYLIKLQYKDKIEPEKKSIREYLRSKRVRNIEDLIRSSYKKNIEMALPHFTTVLSELSE